LVSGGLDSAILVSEILRIRQEVHPLYVRTGMFWEPAELAWLRRFLTAVACPRLHPLVELNMPADDLYGSHWSTNGRGVPPADSPDESVLLAGRNVLLLAKAMLWCHLRGVPEVALAPLASNPFPDATDSFFATYQDAVNQGVAGNVRVWCPFATCRKAEILSRAAGLPLELTFSCIHPQRELHCGRCNKCGERRRAFRDADLPDPTRYVN
jgi:7-cyano-7-deazaguanine synthase